MVFSAGDLLRIAGHPLTLGLDLSLLIAYRVGGLLLRRRFSAGFDLLSEIHLGQLKSGLLIDKILQGNLFLDINTELKTSPVFRPSSSVACEMACMYSWSKAVVWLPPRILASKSRGTVTRGASPRGRCELHRLLQDVLKLARQWSHDRVAIDSSSCPARALALVRFDERRRRCRGG